MKKILFSLFVLMLPMFGLMAQISKGSVKVEITETQSDNEQMAMGLEMMKGTETSYYFDGAQYVTKMAMMGGMVNIETHVNSATKKMDLLFDAMGNKMWVDSNMDEARAGQDKITNDDVNIVYDKADSKIIHGLKAYKFEMKVPNPQGDMDIEGYISDEIKTDGNLIQGMENVVLEGFPLEFTIKNSMFSIKMEATEVKKDVDSKVFDMNTSGYKKMTMDEFQKQMQGMGGMGF